MPKTATRSSRTATPPAQDFRRWCNFPQAARRRLALKSSAEGTLANIGVVVRPPDQLCSTRAPSSNQHIWIDDDPRLRRRHASPPQPVRPYVPTAQGPVFRSVHPSALPPSCIHCGGASECVSKSTSCDWVERSTEWWQCKDTNCLGRLDSVIRVYPLGQYDRRG
jgi:hypothetical protein